MTAIGRKHVIVVAPQSCQPLAGANQPATAFGVLSEMALSARSRRSIRRTYGELWHAWRLDKGTRLV